MRADSYSIFETLPQEKGTSNSGTVWGGGGGGVVRGNGGRITSRNIVSKDSKKRREADRHKRGRLRWRLRLRTRLRRRRRWRRRHRLRRRWRRRLITRWPFSVWTARWPRSPRGAGGVGGGDGGVGDRTRATRTPAPVRGVVLPETGGASDRPGSWPRRWAAALGPGPTVERPRRTRSAGPAAWPPAGSTRSSLPSAALAFPSVCEHNKQTVSSGELPWRGAGRRAFCGVRFFRYLFFQSKSLFESPTRIILFFFENHDSVSGIRSYVNQSTKYLGHDRLPDFSF